MADRKHHLEFEIKASSWAVAERYAANKIRTYTREDKIGPDKSTDEQVLRNAEFWATPIEGNTTLWDITVKVTV